jgi:chromate transporter
MSGEATLSRPASVAELFSAFTLIALQGFGGVLPVSERVLCEQKRWLSPAQYVETLAMAQVLPGPNVCNLALMVGDRFFGVRGALSSLAGLMAAPFVIVLAITAMYSQFAALPAVAGALKGMSAVAAGLIAAMGLRLAPTLRENAMPLAACAFFGGAAFIGVALLHAPLALIVLGVGAGACAFAWLRTGGSEKR